jgi:hypothetical protein
VRAPALVSLMLLSTLSAASEPDVPKLTIIKAERVKESSKEEHLFVVMRVTPARSQAYYYTGFDDGFPAERGQPLRSIAWIKGKVNSNIQKHTAATLVCGNTYLSQAANR